MENIGIIRRIDDLGRIVIPKDMRNSLRIKTGDCVEVFLEKDKIVILKQDVIKNKYENLETILLTITKLLKVSIAFTDTDKIINIYGKEYKKFLGNKISNYMYNKIIKRESIYNEKIFFLDNNLYISLKPIVLNGDVLGSIIFFKKDAQINEAHKICMDLVLTLFLNNLEV